MARRSAIRICRCGPGPDLLQWAVHRLLVFLLLPCVLSCSEPADRPASWDYIHPAVIVPSCVTASCHSSLTQRAGINLEDKDAAYRTLIDLQYVVPGDTGSALLFLLEGDERTLMPPNAPLPEADVELIRQWILDGASQQ